MINLWIEQKIELHFEKTALVTDNKRCFTSEADGFKASV
jgi:hypothetical protein